MKLYTRRVAHYRRSVNQSKNSMYVMERRISIRVERPATRRHTNVFRRYHTIIKIKTLQCNSIVIVCVTLILIYAKLGYTYTRTHSTIRQEIPVPCIKILHLEQTYFILDFFDRILKIFSALYYIF